MTTQTRQPDAIRPGANESQPEFAVRFHQAMQRSIPDPHERSLACFRAYEAVHGKPEAFKRAVATFPQSQFVLRMAIPLFCTHEIEDEHGKERVGLSRLKQIIEFNNERAIDRDSFAPLIDGKHTPKPEDAEDAEAPEVLGYAGNYRLGMIGRRNPKWCVYYDEWHHREDVPRLNKLRRRSVECWEDGLSDPIAALGAITPRLELGMVRYARNPETGQRVRRYSAALPAGDNTSVPSHGGNRKNPVRNQKAQSMITDQDIAKIVDGVMNTDEMSWVREQMNSGPDGATDGPDEFAADDELDVDDDLEAEEFGEGIDVEGTGEGIDVEGTGEGIDVEGTGENPDFYDEEMAEFDDDDREDYERMSDDEKACYRKGYRRRSRKQRLSRTQFSRNRGTSRKAPTKRDGKSPTEYARLEREVKELRGRVGKAESERRDYARRQSLAELQHDGYSLDIEEEIADCREMTDDQFEAHRAKIVRHYQRMPTNGRFLHTEDLKVPASRDPKKRQDYSRKRSQRATQIALRDGVSYEQALEQAAAELGDE